MGIVEESKVEQQPAQMIVEETKQQQDHQGLMFQQQAAAPNNGNNGGGGLLTIDTGAGNQPHNSVSNALDMNDLRKNKTQYLDVNTNSLLRKMYTKQFPDIISTILRLKHSKKISDVDCKKLVENINGRFLRTVIQILSDRDEFEHIFHRLKKEYDEVQRQGGEKQEAIIQWYTELFKEFSEDLIE